jgi:hypothetical protein
MLTAGNTIKNIMKHSITIIGIVILCGFLVSGCNPKRHGFTTRRVYTHSEFSGDDITGRVIYLLPFLTEDGFDTLGALSLSRQEEWFKKNRPDLKLEFGQPFDTDTPRVDSANIAQFYSQLLEEDMLAFQTNDSIWEAINTDYLLVPMLRHGKTVRGFDKKVRRAVRIEAELWDARRAEVVWHYSVKAVSIDDFGSERDFFWSAITRIYLKIPRANPYTEEPVEW